MKKRDSRCDALDRLAARAPVAATPPRHRAPRQRRACSFDDLVGEGEKRLRDSETECLSRRQIYDEIEFGRLLDRDVARLRAVQNLINIISSAPKQIRIVCGVGHQTSCCDLRLETAGCR